MAEVIRYVDTDVVGGLGNGSSWANAHPTLADWETDNQTNLDTANNWMHAYVRGAADDTGRLTIDGWTTSATDYILIEATSDSTGKHAGVWDAGKYIIHANGATADTIISNEDNVKIWGIQILQTDASTNKHGFYTGNANNHLKNVLIKAVKSGTATGYGITFYSDAGATLTVENVICFDWINGTTDCGGIWSGGSNATLNVYSSTVGNSRTGIHSWNTGSTINCYNTVVFNTNDDFYEDSGGVITCDYCASDDANASTYTHGVDFTSEATDWGNIFDDYANDNFDLKTYTGDRCIVRKGTSKSYGDPDIKGYARGNVWDIGAHEHISGSTTSTTTSSSTTSSSTQTTQTSTTSSSQTSTCSGTTTTETSTSSVSTTSQTSQSSTSSSHTTSSQSTQTSTTSSVTTSSTTTSSVTTTSTATTSTHTSTTQSTESSTSSSHTTTSQSTQTSTTSSVTTSSHTTSTHTTQSSTSSSLTTTSGTTQSSTTSSTQTSQSTTSSSQTSTSTFSTQSSTTTTEPGETQSSTTSTVTTTSQTTTSSGTTSTLTTSTQTSQSSTTSHTTQSSTSSQSTSTSQSSTCSVTTTSQSTVSTTSGTTSTHTTTSQTSQSSTTSSGSTSTQSSTSSSTTTTVYYEYSCIAYGEENPDVGELAKSWQTWEDGSPIVQGDSAWGKLGIPVGASNVGPVESIPAGNKAITATLNKYGTGEGGTPKIYVRGSGTSFAWDDGTPEWEEYGVTIYRTWAYIQWKLEAIE